jgi:hypothetical protein
VNPLLIKLIVAFAPSIEQLIAALLSHWVAGGKRVLDPERVAKKVVTAAEAFAAVVTNPVPEATAPQKEALAAWSKAQPTPESFKKLE